MLSSTCPSWAAAGLGEVLTFPAASSEEDHGAGDGEGSGVQIDVLPAQRAGFADPAAGGQEQIEQVGAAAALSGPDGFGGAPQVQGMPDPGDLLQGHGLNDLSWLRQPADIADRV